MENLKKYEQKYLDIYNKCSNDLKSATTLEIMIASDFCYQNCDFYVNLAQNLSNVFLSFRFENEEINKDLTKFINDTLALAYQYACDTFKFYEEINKRKVSALDNLKFKFISNRHYKEALDSLKNATYNDIWEICENLNIGYERKSQNSVKSNPMYDMLEIKNKYYWIDIGPFFNLLINQRYIKNNMDFEFSEQIIDPLTTDFENLPSVRMNIFFDMLKRSIDEDEKIINQSKPKFNTNEYNYENAVFPYEMEYMKRAYNSILNINYTMETAKILLDATEHFKNCSKAKKCEFEEFLKQREKNGFKTTVDFDHYLELYTMENNYNKDSLLYKETFFDYMRFNNEVFATMCAKLEPNEFGDLEKTQKIIQEILIKNAQNSSILRNNLTKKSK